MKPPLFRRIVLVAVVAATSLMVAGCNSKPTIAPNWYDSAFHKDGAVSGDDNLATAPTAQPGNR